MVCVCARDVRGGQEQMRCHVGGSCERMCACEAGLLGNTHRGALVLLQNRTDGPKHQEAITLAGQLERALITTNQSEGAVSVLSQSEQNIY